MTKEQILDQLYELGFQPETVDEGHYLIRFEGVNLLYINDENDQNFFRLCVPGIYEVNDENRAMVNHIANEVAKLMKYTKCIVLDDDVWIAAEQYLPDEINLEPFLTEILYACRASFACFVKTVQDITGE